MVEYQVKFNNRWESLNRAKMEKIPLLIVDDDDSHLKIEILALEEGQYDIRTAHDAKEALHILENFTPRLILMDILLPGMNGLELTRELKEDPKYKNIPIIAITAYGMTGDKEVALDAGCSGYITKPIDVERFSQVISDYLNQAHTNEY